ncbi:nucleotidyltransferase family protein [Puniceicoccaceae bacterium K14]|nr:nucleotidyltransferase family protein [Puniceicoccaceae bacterium K14]
MSNHTDSLLFAIILAAGASRRFPGQNKLFAKVHGTPILEHVVQAITYASVDKTIVVTGQDHEETKTLLSSYPVDCIQNSEWEKGMGNSLAFGAKSLAIENPGSLLICLADLPYLDTKTVNQVIEAFKHSNKAQITAPHNNNRLGHPIIFPNRLIPELATLTGDTGAKNLIQFERNSLIKVPIETHAIFQDIDTPEDMNV